MEETKNSNYVLGFVPSRRIIGVAIIDNSNLHHYCVKSLKRYKSDCDKMILISSLLSDLITRFKPRAIVALKLSPLRLTNFNQELITTLRGMAENHQCPFHSFSLSQVKKSLGENRRLKNQRQLANTLSKYYPELLPYRLSEPSAAIKDREKYYQPLFLAVGLALSYFKRLENENKQNSQ